MAKLITYKKERNSYQGINYYLVLVGEKNQKKIGKEDVNPKVWWVVEYDPKDELLVKNVYMNFLWYDTKEMTQYRLKDKYHQCDLVAMEMIQKALGGNFFTRIKFILKEIKSFLICERLLFIKRIKYFYGNKMDKKMGK
jgi:hypothetical protein